MTIGDYIGQLQRVNAESIAAAAMDENEEAITDYLMACWTSGTNPDGVHLFNASWDGGEVSEDYRRKWSITNYRYSYRYINISGDTRRNLNVRGGRIFSTPDYWSKILKSFDEAGFSPVSFARVPTSIPAKRLTANSFFRLFRAKMARV